MPIFLLIRHGETDYNKKKQLAGRMSGVHLDSRGQQQATALAERLAKAPIRAIYSSPLERTLETAEPLARALNLEIIPLPGLLETDCGEWQGQSVKKLRRQKVWRALQGYPSLFRFPGGESIAECQQRMVQVLETIGHQHASEELVAVFSHADPIKQLVAFLIGLPLDHFQRLAIDLASVTMLQVNENGSRLILLNSSVDFSWEALQPSVRTRRKSTPSKP